MAGMGGMAEMLRSGDIGPPPGGPGEESAPEAMPLEEANAFLQSKGIAPEEFETLVAAVTTIIESQMGGAEEAPPEEPPMPEDDGLPPI
jgi:hypothetical protein